MITRTGIHALRALTELAELPDSNRLGSASLAERIDAPPNYLGKLLQNLAREGLVESRKGSSGGFRLARDPGTIRLIDVLEPIEQVSRWDGCFLGRPVCSEDDPCAIHERWAALRDSYLGLMTTTTIADLARSGMTPSGIPVGNPTQASDEED
jgi:Rrf2 family protein